MTKVTTELPPELAQEVEPEHQEVEAPKTVSLEEFERVQSTNARLLEENKAHKRRKEKVEQEKLLLEGNKDEVIKKLTDRIGGYETKEENDQVSLALATEARKRGVDDWDLLYNSVDHDVKFDRESGSVVGVQEFFESSEEDPRLNRLFFANKDVIKTDNTIPDSTKIINKSDPLAYLMSLKETSPDKYQAEVDRMTREGIIR